MKPDKETLVCEPSDVIKHVYMHWEFTEIEARKNKNQFFHEHFLNIDISFNIP